MLQFESINSSALNLLYGPILIFVHDYWKNHRFDYMDLWENGGISVNSQGRRLVLHHSPLYAELTEVSSDVTLPIQPAFWMLRGTLGEES